MTIQPGRTTGTHASPAPAHHGWSVSSAAAALQHPFLSDPLLSDEQAQGVLRRMLDSGRPV